MELPLLKLIITKGPREGETVEFRPGSKVRIGRLVRGNNLTIKDAGISSNHLIIGSDSEKWTVQDLDSSNGTTLNATLLPPFKPFDLRDGDILKLGELTSILVQLPELTSQLRRNPRRRVNQSSKAAPAAEKQTELEPAVDAAESKNKLRPRRAKTCEKVSEVAEPLKEIKTEEVNADHLEEETAAAVPESRRRGRPPKARARDNDSESQVVNLKVTRSRKKVDCVVVEEKVKKTRGGRRKKEILQECPSENARLDGKVEEESADLGLRNPVDTRENAIDVAGAKEELDSGENCGGGAEEGGVKENVDAGRGGAQEGGVKESVDAGRGWAEEDGVEESVDAGRGGAEDAGVEKSVDAGRGDSEYNTGEEKSGNVDVDVDLEKMTLGEWFDYLEVNLPKQIIEVTEKMIEGMQKKAELVREYMEEQKKIRGPTALS